MEELKTYIKTWEERFQKCIEEEAAEFLIGPLWAEAQHLNYLLTVVEVTNDKPKEKKKATNSELSRALVD